MANVVAFTFAFDNKRLFTSLYFFRSATDVKISIVIGIVSTGEELVTVRALIRNSQFSQYGGELQLCEKYISTLPSTPPLLFNFICFYIDKIENCVRNRIDRSDSVIAVTKSRRYLPVAGACSFFCDYLDGRFAVWLDQSKLPNLIRNPVLPANTSMLVGIRVHLWGRTGHGDRQAKHGGPPRCPHASLPVRCHLSFLHGMSRNEIGKTGRYLRNDLCGCGCRHWLGPLFGLLVLDIGSHWMQMHASCLQSKSSHKEVQAADNWLLRLYYGSRPVMLFCCVGAEVATPSPPSLHLSACHSSP